jgi:uncharacterized protein (UPF0332 family)
LIDFDLCIEKGLLRKILPSKEKALRSIEKAKQLLAEAEANLKEERIDTTVIITYLAIFHAARAVLFKDGFREKSHECIIRYLEKKHSEIDSDTINKLEEYKSERNQTQYDITYQSTEEHAEKMIEFAHKFIHKAEEIIH